MASSGVSVPRNLKYDQTDQSTLAETLIAKQAPEGRSSQFKPDQKIDFRFPTSGGYVDSFASSTLDFDLDVHGDSVTDDDDKTTGQHAWLDPYLGAHQLINRIVVTIGGNIIEDTTNYALVFKEMKALHGNRQRMQIDMPLSEDNVANWQNDHTGERMLYWKSEKILKNKTNRYRCRLNLMSCLGSLSGSKYWPSTLLDSDIRLEIYLNSKNKGMILQTTLMSWELNNVEFTMTRIRLNTRVIDALKASAMSGGVKMIMPGFSHFQETLAVGAAGSVVGHNTKYSSSASSLKSILISFRNQAHVDEENYNTYNLVDPCGLEYQFLIGSTLMPARPISYSVDKYRELMRCMGGPINSLGQRNLLTNYMYNGQNVAADDPTSVTSPKCHLIGQSLEMYADHTLSNVVFSGINAINLTMQCQLKITGVTATSIDPAAAFDAQTADNLTSKTGAAGTNANVTFYVDSVLVFDRLLSFNGMEVTMGY